ncbi:MAG: hypothetical protein Q8K32_29375 [Archangium sp.]|nr:hypothetical protein [Archangium sp.]
MLPPLMGRLSLVVFLFLSCATTGSANSKDAPAGEAAQASAAGGDDLASAFEPEAEKTRPVLVRPVVAAPVDRTLGFKAAISEGQASLKSKQVEAAREAASRAVKEAETLDGEARHQAGQLAFKVELAGGDVAAARDAATAWRLSCGPEKADSCRSAALTGLMTVSKLKGADKKLLQHVHELQDAEVCAAKTAKPNPCEATAVRLGSREKDLYLVQKVQLGQALREDAEGRQIALLEKAEGQCELVQCAGLRRKALGKLIAHARAKNDVDGAVKLAMREVAVISAGLPEEGRAWARTAMLDQTCVSYDTAHGAGSCRALERKVLGRWTFHDYSRDQAGQGLSADQVRTVNEHFAPLLQECLADQAKRMTPPDAQRFEVRWVVFNDGRVGEAHLRRDLDETQLAKCLRAQFNGWRYPRYEGEYQNVEQSFTVTAVERRTR